MTDAIARTDSFMTQLGLEVYRVGGSVRDEVMGRKPKDADYMVRGIGLADLGKLLYEKGEKYSQLADRGGRQLGVRLARGGVEITLPRKEISTGPGHRDFDIVLDPDLGIAEDALRRDFTFNALYKPLMPGYEGLVSDPTGCGLYDLQHRFIRTTHAASFRDDPLRILRALRFMATLGYDLTADAMEQMREHADAVTGLTDKGVSGTVFDEFSRMLGGPNAPKALRAARDTGVLATALPELAPMIGFDQGSRYHDLSTDEHTFKALETAAHVDAPLRVRWALLFHDAGKPETAWRGADGRLHYYAKTAVPVCDPEQGEVEIPDHQVQSEHLWRAAAERLNVPREIREGVATLIRDHMVACDSKIKRTKVHRERVRLGDSMLSDLYLHRMCDLTGKGKANRKHMANIAAAELLRKEAERFNVPRSVKDLQITGTDVMALGIKGRMIGEFLAAILDEIACDPSALKLSREWQLNRLGTMKGSVMAQIVKEGR